MTNGSANYYSGGYVDPTYYTTEVGAYDAKPSDSAYGTFDQGGNLWEWNETLIGSSRGLRGGSFRYVGNLRASSINCYFDPTEESRHFGFRVAEIPEPGTVGLLLAGGLALVRRRR
jgi:formylglycine-generating enzyme required for sulfatase activity